MECIRQRRGRRKAGQITRLGRRGRVHVRRMRFAGEDVGSVSGATRPHVPSGC